jgi:hypothetical protein
VTEPVLFLKRTAGQLLIIYLNEEEKIEN